MFTPSGSTERSLHLASVALAACMACCAMGEPPGKAIDLEQLEAWPVGSRTWIGPAFAANRLHDWQLRDGRVECIEHGRRFPLRTLHWLTRTISVAPECRQFSMTVTLGPRTSDFEPDADTWAGFLLGVGGPHVDHRLSALVHGKPAEDGGLLALVDGTGRGTFRANDVAVGDGPGSWSIGGRLPDHACSELPDLERPIDQPITTKRPRFLTLDGLRGEDGWKLTLSIKDFDHRVHSVAVAHDVSPSRIEGGVALVSHRGAGYWFESWALDGDAVVRHADRVEGPTVSTLYTLSDQTLTLTAQMFPLGPADPSQATLQVWSADDEAWMTVATAARDADARTATFRVDGWNRTDSVAFRVIQSIQVAPDQIIDRSYEGTIRSAPSDPDHPVIAALTCHKVFTGGLRWNHDGLWFPHTDLVDAVAHHDPDLLYFSGDQIYEGDLTPVVRAPTDRALLDYLDKWYRWCRAFAPLTRHRPCITIPDDHDVYHGNLWGAGGRKAEARDGLTAQDSGGYKMPARFVNAVHRTQTAHLPAPFDPAPVEQGISVYTTHLRYGGISFAIFADRQWKSSPAVVIEGGSIVNGWTQDPDFDPATGSDVPGAVLLGERQLRFLDDWASDYSGGAWIKIALSQTLFANLATLPRGATSGSVIPSLPLTAPGEWPDDYTVVADHDSGGWPQSGRNEALRILRKGFAFHLCGDQHLGSTLQYGIDVYRDAGYAFCTPSIANTWPRRWMPAGAGPTFTGDFLDGFGNRMSVDAVANPAKYGHEPAALLDRATGYGIVRIDRGSRTVRIECWPRWEDPSLPDARQYDGWPVTFHQLDNHGGRQKRWLPTLRVEGLEAPVIQVLDDTGAVVYTVRSPGPEFDPPVFGDGPYTVRVFDPDLPGLGERRLTGLTPAPVKGRVIPLDFDQ